MARGHGVSDHYDIWVQLSNEVDDLPDLHTDEVAERVEEIVRLLRLYVEAR